MGRRKGVTLLRHQQNNISFEKPSGWMESTVASFTPGGPLAPTILMVREPMGPHDTLRTHVDHTLIKLGKELSKLDVLENREMQVGGRDAVVLCVSFVGGEREFEQSMVMIDPARDPDRRIAVFVACTPRERAAEARAVLARVLETVRFGEPTSAIVNEAAGAASQEPTWDEELPMIPMPGLGRR